MTMAAGVPNCLTGQAVADALQVMVGGGPSVSNFLVRKLDENFDNVSTTGSLDVDLDLPNAGWRATAPTLRECTAEFEMVWKPGDAGFTRQKVVAFTWRRGAVIAAKP